jgi:hypothetical protein
MPILIAHDLERIAPDASAVLHPIEESVDKLRVLLHCTQRCMFTAFPKPLLHRLLPEEPIGVSVSKSQKVSQQTAGPIPVMRGATVRPIAANLIFSACPPALLHAKFNSTFQF